MKIADQIVFESGDGFFSIDSSSGIAEISLDEGGDDSSVCGVTVGGVYCGKFAETDAPVTRLRSHATDDGKLFSVDMARRIAFGCEYTVEREFELAGNFLKITTDITAGMTGALASLDMEELFFAGDWEKVQVYAGEVLKDVRITEGDFFQADRVPLLLRLVSAGGMVMEYACGNDYWRQVTGSGNFRLEKNPDGIIFHRRLFQTAAGGEPDRKSWRVKALLSWKVPGEEPEKNTGDEITAEDAFGGMCMTSAIARKNFRDFVRSGDNETLITGCRTHFCSDAGHLERPGKKELYHYDLEDYLNFYLWGNRTRLRNGGEGIGFEFMPGSELENGAFASVLENLSF